MFQRASAGAEGLTGTRHDIAAPSEEMDDNSANAVALLNDWVYTDEGDETANDKSPSDPGEDGGDQSGDEKGKQGGDDDDKSSSEKPKQT
mgnify:CR=1 FL=1